MVNDYITDYIKARKENDTAEMIRIERKLSSVGMDRATLTVLANELEKENKEEN